QTARREVTRDPDSPLDVLVVPSYLSGMTALWNVALEAEDLDVVQQATRLLNRAHQELAPELVDRVGEIREEYISTCMAYVRQEGDDKDLAPPKNASVYTDTAPAAPANHARRQRLAVRALHLLEEFVDETEMGGTGGLRGHGARVRGAKVGLSFDSKVPEPTRMACTFKLEMHSNTEVWEVRRRVARMARLAVKDVELKLTRGSSGSGGTSAGSYVGSYHGGAKGERRSVEALDRSNSRRLGDLGLRSDDVWVITRRQAPTQARATLLDGWGKLLPRPLAIFDGWFREFQNADGMMDRVGAANFIDSCCHDRCKPTDERVNKFFRNYDADGDGLLGLEDFLRLFQDSCKDMPQVVWSNLKAHQYRDDLSRPSMEDATLDESDEEQAASGGADAINPASRNLPRSIISRDAGSVNRLLSVLDLGGPAADAAWRFLMRLPTNPEMLKGVRRLETFRSGGVVGEGGGGGRGRQEGGREGWKALLGPPGSHRMLYTLQIVDGVLETVTGCDGDGGGGGVGGGRREWESMDCEQWVADFVRSGGFAQFCEAILTRGLFGDGHPEEMMDTQQACLTLILKVVRIFLMGVLSNGDGPRREGLEGVPSLAGADAAAVGVDAADAAVDGDGGGDAGGIGGVAASSPLSSSSSSSSPDGGGGANGGASAGASGIDSAIGGGSGIASASAIASGSSGSSGSSGGGTAIGSGSSATKSEAAQPAAGRGKGNLWASLPSDVVAAVLGVVEVSELQARLMELAGVAADIVDATSRTARGHPLTPTPTLPPTAITTSPATPNSTSTTTARRSATPNNTACALQQTPLELFGCVGEGAPAESMAQEALLLWVGVFRLSPQSRALLQGAQDTGQRDKAQGDAEIGGEGGGGGGDKALDKPVLKAILCASDAIRQRVAQSLLQACGVGPAAAAAAAAAEAGEAAAAAAATVSAVGGSEVAASDAALEKETDCSALAQLTQGRDPVAAITTSAASWEGEGGRGGMSVRDELREHVVRLLLDNIPR
ncbi:unnamed protein product, partial [Laminaria digitata]